MHTDLILAALCSACLVEFDETPNGGLTILVTCHRLHACHYCNAPLAALAWRARADRTAEPSRDDDPGTAAPALARRR